jgi:hypothetical protein
MINVHETGTYYKEGSNSLVTVLFYFLKLNYLIGYISSLYIFVYIYNYLIFANYLDLY